MYILFYIDVTKNAHTHYEAVAWMNANSPVSYTHLTLPTT